MTLVRTTAPSEKCVFDELGLTLADEELAETCGEADCMDDEGFTVLVKMLVILLVIVGSFTTVVVGVAFGKLAVTVMCMVDVCASGLETRPGSKMIGSNIPGSTNAFCILDKVTADMVVTGKLTRVVGEG